MSRQQKLTVQSSCRHHQDSDWSLLERGILVDTIEVGVLTVLWLGSAPAKWEKGSDSGAGVRTEITFTEDVYWRLKIKKIQYQKTELWKKDTQLDLCQYNFFISRIKAKPYRHQDRKLKLYIMETKLDWQFNFLVNNRSFLRKKSCDQSCDPDCPLCDGKRKQKF